MHRLFVRCLTIFLAFVGVMLAGCDESPTSVEDFEIQPSVNPSTSSLTFTQGEAPTFEITYQGLDSAPQLEGAEGLAFEKVEETGSPETSGRQTWAVSYKGEVPSAGSVEETITIHVTGGGREIAKTIGLVINSPISVSETFENSFAVVNDYEAEQREVVVSGGTAVETVSGDVVASNSNGLHALRVEDSGSGSVTFERETNAPGQGVFTFLVKPDPSTDFTLSVTFVDEANSQEQVYTAEVPVAAGSGWRRVTMATQQLFEGFNPVAQRSGGDGPLLSVSMSADQSVTYVVDELAFGTSEGPTIEVNDFEQVTFAYMADTITAADTDQVGEMSDGPTAHSLTWSGGGSFFGYNYQVNGGPALFLDASEGSLEMIVGRVTKGFTLFVFLETGDGTFGYGGGVEVPVQAGESFREVEIPLSSLGGNLAALSNPGITNLGFEIRRLEEDESSDPISFILDGIKLRASN